LEGYEKMDLRLLTLTTVKEMFPLKGISAETTLEVIQCLAVMEVKTILLVADPDGQRFIYNINRIRQDLLPKEFKYLSKGRKYITLKLPELESLLIIRVK